MNIKIKYLQTSIETKKDVQEFLKEWYSSNQTIKVQTSGSTSKPKTIELEKIKMLVSAQKTLDFLKIKEQSTAFLCLSPATIAGKMMIVRAIVGKLNLIVGPVDSNPLKNITSPIDFIALVPLQLQKILEQNPSKLKSIEAIIVGGGPISDDLNNLLISNEISVLHTYGMTETISHVAMRKIGENEQNEYHALSGIQFSTKHNKLIVDYPEIGIHNLETNDLVDLKSSTSFEWKGRADFIINSGGIKISPEEIETLLATQIKMPFFFCGIEDQRLGQKIVIIVESEKNEHFKKVDFKEKLPKYAIPREIIYLPQFIRTISGKINRIETQKLIDKNVIREVL